MTFFIRPITEKDITWMRTFWEARWGSPIVVTRGKVHQVYELPGYAAEKKGNPVGSITYKIIRDECEIISLDSHLEGYGVGSRLLEAVEDKAREERCRRIWLITTNDNLAALRFYQKRGYRLVAIYTNALEKSRKLKPKIPLIGLDGIPLKDEIELEKRFTEDTLD